jgi:hypothetical protein
MARMKCARFRSASLIRAIREIRGSIPSVHSPRTTHSGMRTLAMPRAPVIAELFFIRLIRQIRGLHSFLPKRVLEMGCDSLRNDLSLREKILNECCAKHGNLSPWSSAIPDAGSVLESRLPQRDMRRKNPEGLLVSWFAAPGWRGCRRSAPELICSASSGLFCDMQWNKLRVRPAEPIAAALRIPA